MTDLKVPILFILAIFLSWTLPGTVLAGSGSATFRSSSQKLNPIQKSPPVYHATPKSNAVIVNDNEEVEDNADMVNEENEQIERMEDEAEKLEEQLKDLEQGGGG